MKKSDRLRIMLLAAFMAICPLASGQEISLRAGESAELGSAYWIENCRSTLNGFAGVDVLDGPPGITLTIREQDVFARRQNCPDKVRGGVVIVTVTAVPARFSGTVRYRVRYNTQDGSRQSSHSVRLDLYP